MWQLLPHSPCSGLLLRVHPRCLLLSFLFVQLLQSSYAVCPSSIQPALPLPSANWDAFQKQSPGGNSAQFRNYLEGGTMPVLPSDVLVEGGYTYTLDQYGCVTKASGPIWNQYAVNSKPGTFDGAPASKDYCDAVVLQNPALICPVSKVMSKSIMAGCQTSTPGYLAGFQIDRGHIIAKSLGGSNSALVNLWPQWERSNEHVATSAWRKMEFTALEIVKLSKCQEPDQQKRIFSPKVMVSIIFTPSCSVAQPYGVPSSGVYLVQIVDDSCWQAVKQSSSGWLVNLVQYGAGRTDGIQQPPIASKAQPAMFATLFDNVPNPIVTHMVWPSASQLTGSAPASVPQYIVELVFRFSKGKSTLPPRPDNTRSSFDRVLKLIQDNRAKLEAIIRGNLLQSNVNEFRSTDTWRTVMRKLLTPKGSSTMFNVKQNGLAAYIRYRDTRLSGNMPLYTIFPEPGGNIKTKFRVTVTYQVLQQSVSKACFPVSSKNENYFMVDAAHHPAHLMGLSSPLEQVDIIPVSEGASTSRRTPGRRLLEDDVVDDLSKVSNDDITIIEANSNTPGATATEEAEWDKLHAGEPLVSDPDLLPSDLMYIASEDDSEDVTVKRSANEFPSCTSEQVAIEPFGVESTIADLRTAAEKLWKGMNRDLPMSYTLYAGGESVSSEQTLKDSTCGAMRRAQDQADCVLQ